MKKKREIIALILLPLLYLYIMKLPALFFLALLSLASIAAQLEFYSMYRVRRIFGLFGTASGLALLYFIYSKQSELQLLFIVFFILLALLRLFVGEKGPEDALSDIAPVAIGFLYIPVILSLQIPIRGAGPEWIIFIGGTVWASDSFAYYFGKTFGKRKLYPSVSPKKTVVGAIGSMVGGALVATVIKIFLIDSLTIYQSLLSGFLMGCIAILGDLTESMFKRDSGVKDSSFLIPGHGGILDKMDGIIFATPVVYVIVRFVAS